MNVAVLPYFLAMFLTTYLFLITLSSISSSFYMRISISYSPPIVTLFIVLTVQPSHVICVPTNALIAEDSFEMHDVEAVRLFQFDRALDIGAVEAKPFLDGAYRERFGKQWNMLTQDGEIDEAH